MKLISKAERVRQEPLHGTCGEEHTSGSLSLLLRSAMKIDRECLGVHRSCGDCVIMTSTPTEVEAVAHCRRRFALFSPGLMALNSSHKWCSPSSLAHSSPSWQVTISNRPSNQPTAPLRLAPCSGRPSPLSGKSRSNV